MTVVGTGEVPVIPTFVGFRSATISEVEGVAADSGSRFSGIFGKAVKGIGVGVAVGVGAAITAIGLTAGKGLERALNIQDATAQLTGLGHDAESVSRIMENALASVKGTAYGLDAAATIAATAVASGIKPGEDLERTLSLTADAATIAKVSLGEMGGIFGKVASSGKLSTDVLNQFSARGVPLLQFVADELGVTADAAADMVSRGEVDFATFQRALDAGVGGAALASGATARGAYANIGAAVGRLGAMFTGGAVAAAPALFESISGAVDRLTDALAPLAAKFEGSLTPAIESLSSWIDGLDFTAIGIVLSTVFDTIKDSVSALAGAFGSGNFEAAGGLGGMFSSMGASLVTLKPALSELGAVLPEVALAFGKIGGAVLSALVGVLGFLADNVDTILQFMPLIIAGFIAWRIATAAVTNASLSLRAGELLAAPVYFANNVMRLISVKTEQKLMVARGQLTAATALNTASTGRSTAQMVIHKAMLVASSVATRAATAAQWLMNAAMTANPIGLIIAGIVLLVAGLVWFFTQTELGQEIWANFTKFLGEAWANIVSVATGVFDALGEFFSGLWDSIVTMFSDAIAWVLDLFFKFHPLGIIIANFDEIVVWFAEFWAGIVQFFQDSVAFLVDLFLKFTPLGIIISNFDAIMVWFGEFWAGIVRFFQDAVAVLVDLFLTWTPLGIIIDNFGGIVGFFVGLWENITGAVSDGVTSVIQWFTDLPGMAMDALGNLGDLLKDSGAALIQGFLDGIEGMVGAIGDAVGGVMDFVGGFFPNSPAERGPFSGAGWRRIGDAGSAIFDEFNDGFPAAGLQVAGGFALNSRAGGAFGAAGAGASGGTSLVYHAAPNQSFDREQDLRLAFDRFGRMR